MCFKLVVAIVTTEYAQQGKESYCGRGFSRGEKNNMGKDSRKKTTKKKRQDKKPLLAGYIILINTSVAGARHASNGTDSNQFLRYLLTFTGVKQ